MQSWRFYGSTRHQKLKIAASHMFHFSLPFQKCSDCEEVHRLKKLVNDLQELTDLYRKYNCRLALCDFEKVIPQLLQEVLLSSGLF